MKILYDHQIFASQKVGGISRYFYELLHRFATEDKVSWELPIRFSSNEYLKNMPSLGASLQELPPDAYSSFLGGTNFRGKGRLYQSYTKFFPAPNLKEVNKALSISHLQAGNFDLFHPTYYDPYFLDHIGDRPYVVTVYDMVHEIFQELCLTDQVTFVKRMVVEKATKIIAISESTKKDLVALFDVPPEKIQVVYLGSSLQPANENTNSTFAAKLPARYLLFVGQREAYKNFYFFIRAILPVLQNDPSLHVVCTGQRFNDVELTFFQSLGVAERLHQHFVDDQQLAILYTRALAFVFPSVYEGFGIPILEAFTCGCPVISSNSSSLPEVGGEAALYFEPKNAASLREAVKKGLYDNKTREELKVKGYAQLARFSWGNTATETLQVYEAALS